MLPANWNNHEKVVCGTNNSMNSNDTNSYYNKENINMLLPTSLGDNSTDNANALDNNNNNNNTTNPNVMAFMGLINQIGMETDKTKEKSLINNNLNSNLSESAMNPGGMIPSMAANQNVTTTTTNNGDEMSNANDLNNYALNVYFNSYANFFAANPNMIPGGIDMIKDTLPQPANTDNNNNLNNTENNQSAMYFPQQSVSQPIPTEDFYNNNNNNNNNICPSMINTNQGKSIQNNENGNNKDNKLEHSMNSSSTSSGFASSFSSNDTSTPHRKEADEIQPQKRLKVEANNAQSITSSASPASSVSSFVTTAVPAIPQSTDKNETAAEIPNDNETINGVAALAAAAFSSTSTAALLRGKNFIAHNSAHHPSGQKKRPRPVPEENKDMTYFEKRKRNNESAKRSRDQRRVKEEQIALRAVYLEQENFQLKAELHKLRTYILQQQQQQALNSCETVQFTPLQF
ncbi:hypothetical protein SNEBB_008127 [Seison nebaliae]|nr:hypothetical protein SNEBB_008127 [Seison nebaliae]